MWNDIFQANLKSFGLINPDMVERAIIINDGFSGWAKFHNPNDISTVEESDEVMVQVLSEDLQDLKLRAWYYAFKSKKVSDEEDKILCHYFSHLCDNHFWMILHLRYKFWEIPNLAIRDGWKIVKFKCDHGMPDIIKKMLGLD